MATFQKYFWTQGQQDISGCFLVCFKIICIVSLSWGGEEVRQPRSTFKHSCEKPSNVSSLCAGCSMVAWKIKRQPYLPVSIHWAVDVNVHYIRHQKKKTRPISWVLKSHNKLPAGWSHLKFAYPHPSLTWLFPNHIQLHLSPPTLSRESSEVSEPLEHNRHNANSSLSLWWRLRHIFVNFLPSHPHSHFATTLHWRKMNFSLLAHSQGLYSEEDKQGKATFFLWVIFSSWDPLRKGRLTYLPILGDTSSIRQIFVLVKSYWPEPVTKITLGQNIILNCNASLILASYFQEQKSHNNTQHRKISKLLKMWKELQEIYLFNRTQNITQFNP